MTRPSGYEPPSLTSDFWGRSDVARALADRDMGTVFRLLGRRAGVSQTQIATATGLAQGRVSEIARGRRVVTSLELFLRIADGLAIPDPGRVLLGIAPRTPPTQRLQGEALAESELS